MTTVTIVGAGFTGLAAAYELCKKGIGVTVLEAERSVGGLAASFDAGGTQLDRFYHHWFTNDLEVASLIAELGMQDRIKIRNTNTGVYYANNFFKLSTPWDLLNFAPLGIFDRLRLGVLALRARRVRHWNDLEGQTAEEWLNDLGGKNAYRIVWEPLLKGKFGPYAGDISAVWFWNKLKLRGGSRGKGGAERLVYFGGGFATLAEALVERIRAFGGRVELGTPVARIIKGDGRWRVETPGGCFSSDRVIATTALPLIADMIESWAPAEYVTSLRRIHYLANICLVLELRRSLSSTYWLNVNDPSFPFVGVIEHTNLERPETYAGRHIVYLSRYLPHTDPLYSMPSEQFLEFSIPFIKVMFPSFERDWIEAHHVWRARWAQPVVEKHYSQLLPLEDGPESGFHVCSMAQVYPEDRGTNYAVRAGRRIGSRIGDMVSTHV